MVNAAYARRERERAAKRETVNRVRREERAFKTLVESDKKMQSFEEAFFALYQRRVRIIRYADGKYRTPTATYTEGQLIQLTRSMWGKVHERELGEVE